MRRRPVRSAPVRAGLSARTSAASVRSRIDTAPSPSTSARMIPQYDSGFLADPAFLCIRVAVAVSVVVAGVAERVCARAGSRGIRGVRIQLIRVRDAGQLSEASGTPSLSSSGGGVLVAVAVGVSVTVAVGVLVGVAVPEWNAANSDGEHGERHWSMELQTTTSAHCRSEPDLLLPMPVMLLLAMFTCTFQQAALPARSAPRRPGPATETTSCTTSVPTTPESVIAGAPVSACAAAAMPSGVVWSTFRHD